MKNCALPAVALVAGHEWQQSDVASALDSRTKTALLALGKTGFLAGLDLTVLVHVTLQGLKILVVEKRDICLVLKNLCHKYSYLSLLILASTLPSPNVFLACMW